MYKCNPTQLIKIILYDYEPHTVGITRFIISNYVFIAVYTVSQSMDNFPFLCVPQHLPVSNGRNHKFSCSNLLYCRPFHGHSLSRVYLTNGWWWLQPTFRFNPLTWLMFFQIVILLASLPSKGSFAIHFSRRTQSSIEMQLMVGAVLRVFCCAKNASASHVSLSTSQRDTNTLHIFMCLWHIRYLCCLRFFLVIVEPCVRSSQVS